MVRLCIALMVVGLLVGCGAAPEAAAPTATPEPSCQQQSSAFLAEIQPLFQEWTDATTLAGSTPRASLSTEIGKLQDIRRRVQAVQAPACAADVRQNLISSMDSSIQAFLAFLGQKPESEYNALFTLATTQLDLFSRNLAHLQANEALEPAPLVVTGLGKRTDIQAPFVSAGVAIQESSPVGGLPRVMGATSDGIVTLELIGPETSIQQASILVSILAFNRERVERATGSMNDLVEVAMPDWSEGSAWIAQAAKDVTKAPQSTAVGNRIVTMERIGVNEDQVLAFGIKVLALSSS